MKSLRLPNNTKLERAALRIIRNNADNYNNYTDFFSDLLQHGCQSGLISELIYYADTVKFYKRHHYEIDTMLQELCEDCGCRPDQLLNGWDDSDPLARYEPNMNALAWFGFEETARRIAEHNNKV